VHLADHGIAADTAELAGNLARAEALGPQFSEKFDALVSPVHGTTLSCERRPESIHDPAIAGGPYHIYA